ncbi:MAG: hypothetical protein ACW99A_07990 [Candidatus Kariarchaeaceae archaeon]|jgi:hypothetical protein
MVFDRDSHEKLDKNIENQYKSIFDELTAIFDRFNISEIEDFEEKYTGLDINIKIVSKIIGSYWNISLDNVVSDFEAEINRKIKNEMQIPDVPTYQIRFALEEGSWIILLRNEFPKLLRSHLIRLVTLEDTIFKTGKAIDDDCAYYLIELDQISKNWIRPFTQYWVNEHEYSKNIDFVIRVISAIFKTNQERGHEIYAGSIRLMQSKISVLQRVNQIKTSSNWALNARSIFATLEEELSLNNYSSDVLNLFVTLATLQKEMLRLDTKKNEDSQKQDLIQYSIVDKIGWNHLDVDDEESLEFFFDALLIVLYDFPDDDPLIAAQKLLMQFLEEIKLPKKVSKKYIDLLESEIETQTSQILEVEMRDKAIVELIEEFLPSLFVQIKQGASSSPLISADEANVKSKLDDQWGNFEAQLLRIKRIDDIKLATDTLKKVLRSRYNVLINDAISPYKSAELIATNFKSILDLTNLEIDKFLEKSKLMIDMAKSNQTSLVSLDQSLIDLLYDSLNQFVIMNADN